MNSIFLVAVLSTPVLKSTQKPPVLKSTMALKSRQHPRILLRSDFPSQKQKFPAQHQSLVICLRWVLALGPFDSLCIAQKKVIDPGFGVTVTVGSISKYSCIFYGGQVNPWVRSKSDCFFKNMIPGIPVNWILVINSCCSHRIMICFASHFFQSHKSPSSRSFPGRSILNKDNVASLWAKTWIMLLVVWELWLWPETRGAGR